MRTLDSSFTGMFMGNSLVSVSGTVELVRKGNPFTKATSASRDFMFLLVNVTIGNSEFDHLWCYGFKAFVGIQAGDTVSFTTKLRVYDDKGVQKLGVPMKCPTNVKIN